MGFRYRKSINLGGGFKINLSKSGIGYSWGTKGFRVSKTARGTTRRTYSIPGTGISYVDETGSRSGNRNRSGGNNFRTPPQPARQPDYHQFGNQSPTRIVQNADIDQFKAAEEGTVSDAIERTMRLNWIGELLLLGTLLILLHPAWILTPIAGIVLIIVAHTAGKVDLEYSFDPEKADEHTRRIDAWQLLAEGDKEWQVLTEQFNNNLKVNAGAGRSLKRVVCRIESGHPYYIRTNVDTIQILLNNKERLIILPNKVFYVKKRKVGMIDYSDFQISVSNVRFVESDPVPKDAQVIDYTWQYVNKNGTPDRRYSNNRRLPVCLYGQVFLRSALGLNIELQISNAQNTKDFSKLII